MLAQRVIHCTQMSINVSSTCHTLYTDELVWSKLETGRLPSLLELKELVSEPSQSFSTGSTVMEADFDDEMDSFS